LYSKDQHALGLLNDWQQKGVNTHWLIPLKKGTQYEVVHSLGKQDKLVRLTTTPQSRTKRPDLPHTLEARLVTRQIKGKARTNPNLNGRPDGLSQCRYR